MRLLFWNNQKIPYPFHVKKCDNPINAVDLPNTLTPKQTLKQTNYYGARYYNPKTSLWLSVDPLADYNPFYNIDHYIDGQHNGGVFNPRNLSVYGYCYQNPVVWVDPNGKQSKVTDIDYNKLEDSYDRNGEGILQREKSLNYLTNQNTNTCAIKLSNALNKAGYPIPKDTSSSDNVRTQNAKEGDSGNFVLDAASMANYLKKIQKPTETYTIKTNNGIDKMIADIHNKYDDMQGIIVYVADKPGKYGATGHADLIYEDWGWDLSFSSGTDVGPYLKEHVLPQTTFKVYIWVLDYDE